MLSKLLVVIAIAPIIAVAGPVDENIPEPWFKNGAPPAKDKCVAGVDTEVEESGSPNLSVKCVEANDGFVGIMQSFSAYNYLGKRLRFSALVKSEGIEDGWGGLWMRVDDHDGRNTAFDNMQDRQIDGNTDWSRQSVVLDVSENAKVVLFGTLMNGKGQLWIADLKLEPVGKETPTTGTKRQSEPQNLELKR